MTERPDIQSWEVTVSVNGESILTIGHNHLSGVEDIDQYADAVRSCAQHLLAFIGTDEQASKRYCPWCKIEHDGVCARLISGGQSD